MNRCHVDCILGGNFVSVLGNRKRLKLGKLFSIAISFCGVCFGRVVFFVFEHNSTVRTKR